MNELIYEYVYGDIVLIDDIDYVDLSFKNYEVNVLSRVDGKNNIFIEDYAVASVTLSNNI
jgi:hypothetical protein